MSLLQNGVSHDVVSKRGVEGGGVGAADYGKNFLTVSLAATLERSGSTSEPRSFVKTWPKVANMLSISVLDTNT